MSRRLLSRFDVRPVVVPFVLLAVILLVGTVIARMVDGVLSVLILVTVAVLGPMLAVTVRRVRLDSRRSAYISARWRAGNPVSAHPAADWQDAA
jgi:hypothetical protein